MEKQATKDMIEESKKINKTRGDKLADREWKITFDKSAAKDMFDMLDVEGKRCQVCNCALKVKNWAGFIYGKPTCKNTMCMMDIVLEHKEESEKLKSAFGEIVGYSDEMKILEYFITARGLKFACKDIWLDVDVDVSDCNSILDKFEKKGILLKTDVKNKLYVLNENSDYVKPLVQLFDFVIDEEIKNIGDTQ